MSFVQLKLKVHQWLGYLFIFMPFFIGLMFGNFFGAEILITYLLHNAPNCKSQDQFLIQYNNIRSLKTQCKQTQLWPLVWTCHIGWVNNCNTFQETCTVEFFDSKVSLKAELHNLLFKHFPSWFGQHFQQHEKLCDFHFSTVSTSMISTKTIVSLWTC